MNIGVDIRPLQRETRFRGIGKYLEHLLIAISKSPSQHHFVFFAEKGLPLPTAVLDLFASHEIVTLPAYYLARIRFVRAFAPPNRIIRTRPGQVDVMLVADGSLGIPVGAPSVVVFHDIIPLLFRDAEIIDKTSGLRKLKRQLASWLYWRKYQVFLNNFAQAAHIIAISEQSKRDLQKYVPAAKALPIDVVYHGAPAVLEPGSKVSLPTGLNEAGKFLLYVGGIDLRKNIVGMAKAYAEIKQSHPELKLVVVGKEFELTDQLQDLGWFEALQDYQKDVVTTGYVEDDVLAQLYAKAEAFVFPSQYEGFGLPILEAMQAGCPVVSYSNSSIPEVAGDAALLVTDQASFAQSLRKILEEPGLRAELITKGKEQAAKFTWQKTASQTLAIIEATGKGKAK